MTLNYKISPRGLFEYHAISRSWRGGNGEAYFRLQGENGGTINDFNHHHAWGQRGRKNTETFNTIQSFGLEGQFAYFVGYFEHQ